MHKDIRDLHKQFMSECEYSAKLRPETLRGYRACFHVLMEFNPALELGDLTPETMADFFVWLQRRKRLVGKDMMHTGVKASTVGTYRNKLGKFFKWMCDRHYTNNSPFLGVPYPQVIYSNKKYLNRESVERIFTCLAYGNWQSTLVKLRNIAMYSILLYCGIRKGELIGLRMLDISLERKELLVRSETSKSKLDRLVPLNRHVVTALKEYISELQKQKILKPYLWVSGVNGERLTLSGFKHLNKKLVMLSGIRFHPHQFRHTFAVNMLSSGADIYKLKQLLGHADIRMTCTYLRCLPVGTMRQDVERLSMSELV